MVSKKRLPAIEEMWPDAEERFEKLMRLMAAPALQTRQEAPQKSDEERDEDCSDTQTPTDTFEDDA
jgi:hypothetical protein